jgi:hypothetical protein
MGEAGGIVKTEISTIVYSTTLTHQHNELIAEANRVGALGGTWSIRHYYDKGWWEEFKINYPDAEAQP